eukprot:TRINITY_DN2166_c0_g1_i4.p1 TRINITY_DN2166_c0_g1~~TRINITY_DN2166_c0_g1_i4.p1  ORF type:complete len:394 (-),score=24.37 TRINITY_DN2166_c0_g1_i4:235-1416(-)
MDSAFLYILLSLFGLAYQQVCDLKSYGAPYKDKEKDTAALQKALNACKNGGIIHFPPGEYILKPFNFSSNQKLRFHNSYVHASTDPEDWPIIAPFPSLCRSGIDLPGPPYSAFISAWNSSNVSIVGNGIIDGHGMAWWYKYFHKTLKHTRGRLIEFVHCNNVLVEGVDLRYSPVWTVHLYDSSDILVQNIKIFNPVYGAMTDGIDPDSSRNVLIRDVIISTGDDHIAIKSGCEDNGREFGKPSENITVANSTFESGFGVTIGSGVASGTRNVRVENCTFHGCTWAIKFKAGMNDGGVVENISYHNITMSGVGVGVAIDMRYRGEGKEHPPVLRNISISDVKGTVFRAGNIVCLPHSPCRDLRLENVNLWSLLGFSCEDVEKPFAKNVHPKFCH